MEKILECKNVCKKYGKKAILNDVSLSIDEGDILGLIGPNGAGKTTLIKIITHLVHMNSGTVLINGNDVTKDYDKALLKVGAIVENPDFYMNLSGLDNLKLKQRLYNVSNDKVMEIVKLVKLDTRINDKVKKYSLGMRQRLGIAFCLLNNPNLLILDEPMNGLDPEGIKDLRDILIKLSNTGVSILISSHILKELDDICNKVCVIKNGTIIEENDINKFKNNESIYIFEVDNTSNINLTFKYEILNDNKIKVYVEKEFIPLIIESFIKSDIKIYSVYKESKTLEEVFTKKVGETC